jgi:hypothetical protein
MNGLQLGERLLRKIERLLRMIEGRWMPCGHDDSPYEVIPAGHPVPLGLRSI